jgi:hypothetical protein
MKAGQSIDALVAEKVMGWEVQPPKHAAGGFGSLWKVRPPGRRRWDDWRELVSYSTDIRAANLLLDFWEGDYEIRRQNRQYLVTLYQPPREWEAWGPSLPLAVCRALLLSVEQGVAK